MWQTSKGPPVTKRKRNFNIPLFKNNLILAHFICMYIKRKEKNNEKDASCLFVCNICAGWWIIEEKRID